LGDFVEPRLIQPTIITTTRATFRRWPKPFPATRCTWSALSFSSRGMEMGNAFTELNDPLEQQRRFEALQELYAKGDEELQPH
jgi:lysyl-tRNA synthetase class 2